MPDQQRRIQNLLENVIRASRILMERGYLEEQEGQKMLRCLLGIRQRFLSKEYMERSPKGTDVDAIDVMILPLDRMLVDAGKQGFQNTILYILKAVVLGAGLGHRILTEEEERVRLVALMERREKISASIHAIEQARDLDEKIARCLLLQKRQQALGQESREYEEKIAQIQQKCPDLLEEILFFQGLEDMSKEALAYIDLTASLERVRRESLDAEDELRCVEGWIDAAAQRLEGAKRWDRKPGEEIIKESVPSKEEETLSREKLERMQKIVENFVDEDEPDVVDLNYKAMEQVFASHELKRFAADSLRAYEEMEELMQEMDE